MKGDYKKILLEAFIILVLASTTGLAVNHIRKDKLRLFGTDCFKQTRVCHAEAKSQEIVSLEESSAFFFKNAAIFVDARSPVAFMMGHIPGALNVPIDQVALALEMYFKGLSPDTMIIVYDGDAEGNVGADVADVLKSAGFKNVLLFPDGWTKWQAKGLPVEIGAVSANG
ncbi:rhodanese-like domain-containing protein [Thermodesulforhabdus norvegica]|uniref:Rhodanese-related sulfurtransferase n=1 Tax=Thermodesulforhabdus norvegica TaxID=39841 RepID=A0A1I4RJU0_9BACT|nr:rhodanese-like domain-containing protein [Thermodesulforhabdus norvegica]SFM52170.1 Rhodanese-related sulfurtransferase [Thermodesulforhabdus norvegica]